MGGRLLETENKRKVVAVVKEISPAVAYRRDLLKKKKDKMVSYKVVAYGRWPLTRSGRLERATCSSE